MQSQPNSAVLRIGSRGSALALAQAEQVRDRLCAQHGIDPDHIEIKTISTAGDRSQPQNTPLGEIGGKGLFSRELEAALWAGEIDLAVHSSKDMATQLPDGLIMPVFLKREDPRDAFISHIAESVDKLPEGARIGSSSLRRRAQLLRARPDLQMLEFRGNVGTRLQKLADGVVDATLLASAGLNRLGMSDTATSLMDPRQFPPAPAQGAIGIELREDNLNALDLIIPLNHVETAEEVRAERAMLAVLDGSCRTPIAAWSTRAGNHLSVLGQVLSPDGKLCYEAEVAGAGAEADTIGTSLGQRLLDLAGPEFIERMKSL